MYRSVSLACSSVGHSSNVMYRWEREARYEEQKLKFGSLSLLWGQSAAAPLASLSNLHIDGVLAALAGRAS